MINPIEHSKTREEAQKYKVEPYVIPADIYGKSNLAGRGGWTWYTGSSSWYYKAGIEYILGLKIKGNTLTVNPSIPNSWNELKFKVSYNGKIINIEIKNKNLKNKKMMVNGTEVNEIILNDNVEIYCIEIFI